MSKCHFNEQEQQELLTFVVQMAEWGCLCQDPESNQEPCMERGEWPPDRCCLSCRARKWLKEHKGSTNE